MLCMRGDAAVLQVQKTDMGDDMTQREQFEKWARTSGRLPTIKCSVTGMYYSERTEQAWAVWQDAQQHSEPDKGVAPPTVDWVR